MLAPQLKSLETQFPHNKSSTGFIFPFGQLNRLILRIECEYFMNLTG